MSNTLPLFWDLASLDVTKRESSALSLITELKKRQQEHQSANTSDWSQWLEQEDTVERLELLCAKDVLYALKRLVRGLPSPRQGARQGFSLTLTELLSMLDFLTVETLMNMILKETATNAQMKRDMLFGRIFGFMSIAQSTALSRDTTKDSDILLMVTSLIEYGRQKPFLREVAHQVLIALLPAIYDHSQKDNILIIVANQVLKDGITTPDALAFALALEQLDSINTYMPRIRLLSPEWDTPYLHANNLVHLGPLMRESASGEQTELHSVWHPQLHSVWSKLLPQAFATTSKPIFTEDREVFLTRWRVLVDNGLFGEGTSHERKYWGFLLMQKALIGLPATVITDIFSRNIMNSLIVHLSSTDRYLHQCVLTTIKAMTTASQQDNEKCIKILLPLVKRIKVNQTITGKTIDQLTRELEGKDALTYTKYLLKRFAQPPMISERMAQDDMDHVASLDRQWILEQLILMTKSSKIRDDDNVMSLIEDALMLHGYLEPQEGIDLTFVERIGGSLKPRLLDDTRILCRQKLINIFVNHLIIASTDNAPRVVKACQRFNRLLQGEDYALASDINDDAERVALTERTTEQLKVLEKQIKKNKDDIQLPKLRAFEGLFGYFTFEALTYPLEEETPLIEDLITCYERLYPVKSKKTASKNKKDKKKKKDEEDEEDEPEPIDVLIDGILSLLARPAAALRDLVKYVFSAFKEEDNEEEEQAIDEDVDMDDSDEDSDDSDISYDSANDDTCNTITRDQIRKAFEAQEDDSDLESLGDDDMAPFDRALEAMFKEKKAAKQEKKKMTEATIQFRLRVIDLIEIFIRKQSSNPLCVELMVPLLTIAQSAPTKAISSNTTTDAVLSRRVTTMINQRLCKLKEPIAGLTDDLEATAQVVKTILKMARTTTADASFSSLCSLLCTQIVRSLIASSSPDDIVRVLTPIMQYYNEALDRFCTEKRTRITPDLFGQLIRRYPLAGWQLIDRLAHHLEIGDTAKSFRQQQLYTLLTTLIQSTPKGQAMCEEQLLMAVPRLQTAFLNDLERMSTELNGDALRQKSLVNRIKTWSRCLIDLIRRSRAISTASPSLWSANPWMDQLQPFVNQLPGQAVKSMVAQLSTLLNGKDQSTPKNKQEKRKHSEDTPTQKVSVKKGRATSSI
ncbi:DNA polymerase phi-domain-containing protein [Syncephalis fuscata]|nr:DNA polymerase phi-domain-containing protein [Syncephalis fuscata]